MEEENAGACHDNMPHKRKHTSEETSKSNGVIISREEKPDEIVNNPCKFTADALSNFLVLENIFHHFNGEDLECFKVVNKRWNYVLGKIYPRHYKVIIRPAHKHPYPGCENNITGQNHVTIQKFGWSSKRSDKKKFSFPEAIALLLNESEKDRIFSIHLGNEIPKCHQDPAVEDFLSKIGFLVGEFTLYSKKEFLDPLCRLIVRHFPNLRSLNFHRASISSLGGPWRDHHEFARKNVLKKLTKITFGKSLDLLEITGGFMNVTESLKAAESFIKMAPNLKEIHEFPVHLVDALGNTGKSNLVKSICYPIYKLLGEHVSDNNEAFGQEINFRGSPLEVALRKFGQLEPKLISFSFSLYVPLGGLVRSKRSYPSNYFYLNYLKPSIGRILQSSHRSLETLTIHPSGAFDFPGISPITSLKKIQFIFGTHFDDLESFTTNIDLSNIFPNVTVLEFLMLSANFYKIEDYGALRLLSPWGSKVAELVLKGAFHLDSNTIMPLAESFSSLKSFQYLGSGRVTLDTLMGIFPLMADAWPEMEVISIQMADECDTCRGYCGCRFDTMFTGIRRGCLAWLMMPEERKRIKMKKIEALYAKSTIRKLSHLKRLELDFKYYSVAARIPLLEKLSEITFLSKEFGFDFLPPNFKILIRERGRQYIFKVPRGKCKEFVSLDQLSIAQLLLEVANPVEFLKGITIFSSKDLKKIQEDLSSVVTLEFETIKEGREEMFYNVNNY